MNKRMSRRDFLKVSGTVAGASLLAACTPDLTSAPAVPTAGAAAAPIELSFWTFINDHTNFHYVRVDAWNAAHPSRTIVLKPSNLPYEDMHNKAQLALQSGTGAPDIIDIEVSRFGNFLKDDIQLVDITSIIDKNKDKLFPSRANLYSKSGVIYGADYHLGASIMIYNTEILGKAGVDIDSIKTWDDYIAAGKKVTNDDTYMCVLDDSFNFQLLAGMNGGGVCDKDGNLVLNSKENIEALQFCQDLIFKHKIAKLNAGPGLDSPANYNAINSGQVASIWAPEWFVSRFQNQIPDLKGKVKVRQIPAMKTGGYAGAMGGGTGTAITNQIAPEKLQTAIDYLEYAKLSLSGQLAVWNILHFDPWRSDTYDDPSMNIPDPVFSDEPIMQIIKAEGGNLAPFHVGPKYSAAGIAINTIVTQEAFVEGGDPAEILNKVQKLVESQA